MSILFDLFWNTQKREETFQFNSFEGVRNSDAEDLKKMKDGERDREGEREEITYILYICNIHIKYIVFSCSFQIFIECPLWASTVLDTGDIVMNKTSLCSHRTYTGLVEARISKQINSKCEMSDLTIQHGEGDENYINFNFIIRGELTGEVAFDQGPNGIKGTST